MGRKRLLTVLATTMVGVGAMAAPAAATELDEAPAASSASAGDERADGAEDPEVTVPIPGVGSVTVAADADEQPSARVGVSAEARQPDVGLDADPSLTVGLSPEGPEVDADGQVGVLGESADLDEVAAPVEDAVGSGDEPADVPEPATTSPRPTAPTGGTPTPPATAATDGTDADRLPPSVVLRDPAATGTEAEPEATTPVLGAQPAPQTAPPSDGALAAPPLPTLPAADVPGLLRALTALLVAGAATTWGLVRRETT